MQSPSRDDWVLVGSCGLVLGPVLGCAGDGIGWLRACWVRIAVEGASMAAYLVGR